MIDRQSWRGRLGLLVGMICGLLVSAAWGEPAPREDMSDDPHVEQRLFQLAAGFESQLVACEPVIVNPVQINFDPQGRLWVLCIPRYPQLLPGQEPRDYIAVLEDFDERGRARKSRKFAEGLTIPTG